MTLAIALFKQPATDLLMQVDANGLHVRATDRRLINAEGCTTIAHTSDAELVRAVNAIVKGASRDMGIHQEPDTWDKTRFVDVLREYFQGMSTVDVKNAFELYVLGDLDAYLPKDKSGKPIGHFQKWSMQFYVAVLRAYRMRQLEAKRDVSGKLELLLNEHREAERDPYDDRCLFLETLKGLIVQVANGEHPLMALTASADYTLKRLKLLPEAVSPTDDDVLVAREKLSHNKGSAVLASFKTAMKAGIIPSDLESASKAIAVRRLVRGEAMRIGPEQVATRFDWYIGRVRKWQAKAKAS